MRIRSMLTPQFRNARGAGLTLLTMSLALAAGTNVSLTQDYFGNTVIAGFA
jgi:hypothetical protein